MGLGGPAFFNLDLSFKENYDQHSHYIRRRPTN